MKSLMKAGAFIMVIFCITTNGSAQNGIVIKPDEAQRKVDVLYDGILFTSYIILSILISLCYTQLIRQKEQRLPAVFRLNHAPTNVWIIRIM